MDKVLRAQAAGAKGVLVIDNGGCDEGFTDCGRLGSIQDGGFARLDGAHIWTGVNIPTLLLSSTQGDKLKRMIRLQRMTLDGLGEQFVQR